ncbi:MAG: hypothetical protein ACI9HE_003974 [Planctomycetota bacterium]|jgi:hypothetical protein
MLNRRLILSASLAGLGACALSPYTPSGPVLAHLQVFFQS